MLYDWLPQMPEKHLVPLVQAFAESLATKRGLAVVIALPAK